MQKRAIGCVIDHAHLGELIKNEINPLYKYKVFVAFFLPNIGNKNFKLNI